MDDGTECTRGESYLPPLDQSVGGWRSKKIEKGQNSSKKFAERGILGGRKGLRLNRYKKPERG